VSNQGDFFDFGGGAREPSKTEVQKPAQPAQSSLQADLFDVFNNQPVEPKNATSNDLEDIFAGGNKPLAPSGQPQVGQSKVDVLGQFYTNQSNANQNSQQ